MATPRLGITTLVGGQAAAEVPMNAALARIDVLVQGVVKDKDLAAPPGSPANGDAYIVAAAATGLWTGQEKNIAYYYNGWFFVAAKEGMLLYVDDENLYYKCTASGPPATWASTSI